MILTRPGASRHINKREEKNSVSERKGERSRDAHGNCMELNATKRDPVISALHLLADMLLHRSLHTNAKVTFPPTVASRA